MTEWIVDTFAAGQLWLFEVLVQPLMLLAGHAGVLEVGFDGAGWLLIGLIQIAVIACVFVPLQRLLPVQPVTNRTTIRTDMLYTAIHRLGLFRVGLFLTVDPLFDAAFGAMRQQGISGIHLDQLLDISGNALLSFVAYVVALDFAGYWIHRGQHQFNWWWKLHSLHHAQQQMTVWSDNRNHLLDDLLVDSLLVLVAQLIGVAPGQFIAFTALTQLSESFQHGNLKIWFGRMGERLLVSPRFHRLHHAVGIGHESIVKVTGIQSISPAQNASPAQTGGPAQTIVRAGAVVLGGHNFGVLLPWWDSLFGTANYEKRFDSTGVRDQLEQGRDYGRGFWSQQWLGVKRLAGRA